jgi:arylsulfatase A
MMAQKQPNFVIIVADDMGYGDVGIYGNEYIKTPNIDQMAREGMMFNR